MSERLHSINSGISKVKITGAIQYQVGAVAGLALSVLVAIGVKGCAVAPSGKRVTSTPVADARYVAPPTEDRTEDILRDPQPLASANRVTALTEAERRYRNIVASGGWSSVPREANGRQAGQLTTLVANRLLLEGDLSDAQSGRVGPDEVSTALRRFQIRHGLAPTGQIDGQTADAMNVSAERRLAQIQANLARVRELTRATSKAPRYVVVNAPSYRLEAVARQTVIFRHRVIVGRPERQTPSVSASIRGINFYPHWHVPESIAQSDLIPRLVRDPEYLTREGFRVLKDWQKEEIQANNINWRSVDSSQLKFRQDPGPRNALGLVRIDMPNEQNVYLHDTPMKDLFKQRNRAFSAGCIRVEGVFDLVTWLLEEAPGWSGSRVQGVIAAGIPVDVPLPKPVPVFFTYTTAWADADGSVNFRQDIYGRDGQDSEGRPGPEPYVVARSRSLSP